MEPHIYARRIPTVPLLKCTGWPRFAISKETQGESFAAVLRLFDDHTRFSFDTILPFIHTGQSPYILSINMIS